jgi:hypothetical protein
MKLSIQARVGAITKGVAGHAKWTFHPCIGATLMLGMAGPDVAQHDGGQQPSERVSSCRKVHTPRIDRSGGRSPYKRSDRIQALLDKNPNARGRSLRLRFTLSATKGTAKFMLC